MLKRTPVRWAVIGVALVLLLAVAGLWIRPFVTTVTIQGVSVRPSNSEYIGTIAIAASDLRSINRREFSVFAKIFNCGAPSDYYPVEIAIQGVSINSTSGIRELFRNNTIEDMAMMSFSVPQRIYSQYRQPCLSLGGGQMVGLSRFKSNTVPVQ